MEQKRVLVWALFLYLILCTSCTHEYGSLQEVNISDHGAIIVNAPNDITVIIDYRYPVPLIGISGPDGSNVRVGLTLEKAASEEVPVSSRETFMDLDFSGIPNIRNLHIANPDGGIDSRSFTIKYDFEPIVIGENEEAGVDGVFPERDQQR